MEFVERGQDPRVQDFGAISIIEALDFNVLSGLAWLNQHERDAMLLVPRPEGVCDVVRKIVTTNATRRPVDRHQLVENRCLGGRWERARRRRVRRPHRVHWRPTPPRGGGASNAQCGSESREPQLRQLSGGTALL